MLEKLQEVWDKLKAVLARWEGHTDGQVSDTHAAHAEFAGAHHEAVVALATDVEGLKSSIAALAQAQSDSHEVVAQLADGAGLIMHEHYEIPLVAGRALSRKEHREEERRE